MSDEIESTVRRFVEVTRAEPTSESESFPVDGVPDTSVTIEARREPESTRTELYVDVDVAGAGRHTADDFLGYPETLSELEPDEFQTLARLLCEELCEALDRDALDLDFVYTSSTSGTSATYRAVLDVWYDAELSQTDSVWIRVTPRER